MMLSQTLNSTEVSERSPVYGVLVLLRLWLKRAQERRELAQLTAYELHDFGASRSEAIAESGKPFWRS
jgi:uncharacterized protein YjiS (DUF1127 family)